jgi:hypothetical protein
MKRNTQKTNRRPFPKWVQGADGHINAEPSYTWEPSHIPGMYFPDTHGRDIKWYVYALDGHEHADQSEKPTPIPADIAACMLDDIESTLNKLASIYNEDGELDRDALNEYINEQVTNAHALACKQVKLDTNGNTARDENGDIVLETRYMGVEYTPRDAPACCVTCNVAADYMPELALTGPKHDTSMWIRCYWDEPDGTNTYEIRAERAKIAFYAPDLALRQVERELYERNWSHLAPVVR